MHTKMQEQPAKVLTTPELIEIILLHLDIHTLLVSAQRVCRTWTALIQSSPALQQALFFQPTARRSSLDETRNLDQGYPPRIYNPLLVQAFPPFFPPAHEYPPSDDNETESHHEGREKKQKETPFSFKHLDMFSSPQKKTAYLRKEASWRKMLLCQPPVYGGVAVFKMLHASGGDSYNYYTVPQHQDKKVGNNDDNDYDDEILKMNHLFKTLTRDRNVYFGRFGETRVYWPAYVPPCKPHVPGERPSSYPPPGGSFDHTVNKALAKAIEEAEVLIYSSKVVQCVFDMEREVTGEVRLREEIVEGEDGEVKEGEMRRMVEAKESGGIAI